MRGAVNDKLRLMGNVKLYELPPDFTFEDFKKSNKPDYLVEEGDNLVVDIGLQQIALLIIGSNTNSFTHCGVGSDSTLPAAGDLDLVTEIGRNTINDRYRVGLTAHFDTFFGKSDQAGSWNETCLAQSASGNDILCRRVFDAAFTKSTSNSAVIAWTITFAAVVE